ncbi:hypothetical protein NDU88_001079 [Pleurodeles waltl]|uniref:Uncharacterized protein n=1 Tax=Pleurodeles waltl TaxID=8319 RepID=A0AAV7PA49_PLEWA|nr:hypothetical protein NDU88_001079 [Pleurodeles waltl]
MGPEILLFARTGQSANQLGELGIASSLHSNGSSERAGSKGCRDTDGRPILQRGGSEAELGASPSDLQTIFPQCHQEHCFRAWCQAHVDLPASIL